MGRGNAYTGIKANRFHAAKVEHAQRLPLCTAFIGIDRLPQRRFRCRLVELGRALLLAKLHTTTAEVYSSAYFISLISLSTSLSLCVFR